MEEYPDVFTGLGKHTKIKAKLIVDESVTPVIHKQRKIPYNLEKKAKEEEQRLEELGVIEEGPGQSTYYLVHKPGDRTKTP